MASQQGRAHQGTRSSPLERVNQASGSWWAASHIKCNREKLLWVSPLLLHHPPGYDAFNITGGPSW